VPSKSKMTSLLRKCVGMCIESGEVVAGDGKNDDDGDDDEDEDEDDDDNGEDDDNDDDDEEGLIGSSWGE